MKNLFCLIAVSLSASAFAGPNSDLLLGHTWQVFFTLEPAYKDRRVMELNFKNQTYTMTCLFSELGLGKDVTIEFQPNYQNFTETTYDQTASQQKSVANDKGQVCSGFLQAGTKAYMPMWGNHDMALANRIFHIKD